MTLEAKNEIVTEILAAIIIYLNEGIDFSTFTEVNKKLAIDATLAQMGIKEGIGVE